MSDDIIKRLERERDEWREACRAHGEKAARAERALADAVAVLEPFADVAEQDIGRDESNADFFRPMNPRYAKAPAITVGDMRRAAATIRARSEPTPEHDRPGPSSTAFDDQCKADWDISQVNSSTTGEKA